MFWCEVSKILSKEYTKLRYDITNLQQNILRIRTAKLLGWGQIGPKPSSQR